MKIGYQLKQVRERLAKGLVDKGVLRTEKRNFLLFDMATHPIADGGAKEDLRRRVRNMLTSRTVVLPGSPFLPDEMEFRFLRTITMVCAAYAANVLENALSTVGHETRERAFAQVDELLAEYSQWPFGKRAGGNQGIGANLPQVVGEEINRNKDKELQMEVGRQYWLVAAANPLDHRCLSQCIHQARLATLSNARTEPCESLGFSPPSVAADYPGIVNIMATAALYLAGSSLTNEYWISPSIVSDGSQVRGQN